MAAELDLVNLRGYSVGRIATAIQHMATVLESGLRLVSNDVTYTFEPVNRKYAHQLVQPVCTGGREEAHLPTARGSCTSVDQEDLTVERCRQLIFGTKTAAQAEVKQYKQCLLLLVNLLKENFRMGIG